MELKEEQKEQCNLSNSKPEFDIGVRVVHRLSGQRMTIKRRSESVATCILEEPTPFEIFGYRYDGEIVVCSIENLDLI